MWNESYTSLELLIALALAFLGLSLGTWSMVEKQKPNKTFTHLEWTYNINIFE